MGKSGKGIGLCISICISINMNLVILCNMNATICISQSQCFPRIINSHIILNTSYHFIRYQPPARVFLCVHLHQGKPYIKCIMYTLQFPCKYTVFLDANIKCIYICQKYNVHNAIPVTYWELGCLQCIKKSSVRHD